MSPTGVGRGGMCDQVQGRGGVCDEPHRGGEGRGV